MCSGAAGLVYEIVWMRLLSLHMGHTVAAAGTVLAAFMGGLASGALLGGHVASRLVRDRALRAYAVLEGVIALCALLLPLALHAIDPLLAWAYGDSPNATFAVIRIASSFGLVFMPAAAMGATFPLAIRWFAGTASTAGQDIGALYAFNTAGAAVSALLTGFVLVPGIGLRGATFVGVTLNAAAAGGAWLISAGKTSVDPLVTRSTRARKAAEATSRSTALWLPAMMLGLSGFTALVYEVTFTRVLALALGPTTYAFAAMLTAFISGLAIGSWLASRVSWTSQAPAFWGGLLMLASATAASMAGWFASSRLPLLIAEMVANASDGGSVILAREVVYAVAVILPLACTLGAVFPLAVALAVSGNEGVIRKASLIYGFGTIGAMAGSLSGAFILVPSLGLQQTLRFGMVVAIATACLAFLGGKLTVRQRRPAIAATAAAVALVLVVPPWDPVVLSGGGYKNAVRLRDLGIDLVTGLRAGTLLYYKDGAAATVTVRRLAGTVGLAIDGKVDASNGTDMLTQKLLAHVPLLLHPEPRHVGIIGLGSASTLAAALRHPIDRADVIEISPEVIEASSFFAEENSHPLQDPRTRLILGDGRSHMQLTSDRYDVIISEPSNPWMAGVASLFTREFFEAARDKLAPDGILCQWAHTYDIADADLRSIAATFADVFPNATMWLVGEADVLFISSNEPGEPRLDNILGGWQHPGVAADLAKVSVLDAFSLLSLYVAGPAEVRHYSQGAVIQTDDRPLLEFSGPRSLFDRRGAENVPFLRGLLDPADAPVAVRAAVAAAGAREWSNRAQMQLKAEAYTIAYTDFLRSVHLDPNNRTALLGLIEAATATSRLAETRQILESLVAMRSDSVVIRLALAHLLAATGEFEHALAITEEAIALEPDNPRAAEMLASIFGDVGDVGRLRGLVTSMEQNHPEREESWYYAAMVSFLDSNWPDTIVQARRAITINARHAPAHNLIGIASANLGQREQARQAFRASVVANPREASTYANLGLLELESGRPDAAVASFTESLTLDPRHELARTNLPVALAALRQR